MKRAVRKRAGKLRGKALKSLSKNKGSDLQSVSNRLSQLQYVDVLERFEHPNHASLPELARALVADLNAATEATTAEEVPKFARPQDLEKIECAAGCSWCCRQPLQVSILGAVSVAAHVIDQGDVQTFSEPLADYVRKIEPYGYQHEALKECYEPCPFLGQDHMCRVYDARPTVCRAFHSKDKACCERIISEKTKVRDVPMFPALFGFIGVRLSGARQALSELGLDDRPVVLGAAVKLLLDDFDGVVSDWLIGGDAFDEVAVEPE